MLLIHEGIPDSSSPRLTAGQLLKNARLAKGVHLAVLAVKLKVPVRQLEALEADEYEAFKGGPAFLRAITLALCRQLDTDAGPVLALLPAAVSSMSVLKASVISGAGQQRISLRSSGNSHVGARSVLGLAALMLLVTAAFLWLPAPEAWWLGFSNNEKASSAEEVAVPLGQASNPESTEAPIPAASAAQSSNFSPPPSAPPPAVVSPVFAPPSMSASESISPESAVLKLDATADAWVEVRDAQGKQTNKLLKAGESLEISPPTPFSVVIGRVAVVKATLRGEPFDLKPYAQQTVARFEVKE